MPVKQYQLKELKDLKAFVETKYRSKVDDLVDLYQQRKIVNYSTAFRLAKGLAGNTGAPKAAIKSIEKYYDAPTAIGRLKKEVEGKKLKTFFVKWGGPHDNQIFQGVQQRETGVRTGVQRRIP